ncbi:MAG: fructose-6-phosphate aldolase, partial [Gemmatimonadetes bacterium]
MKIFLDTADVAEIRRAAEAGLIDGVTTNPSLMAKVAGERDPHDLFLEICEAVDGPVSAEVVAVDAAGMLEQGRRLAAIHDNIVIKVPLTEQGLRACRALRAEGIAVNVTLCFSVTQAMLAAKAGATYISPFIGRVDDISGDGMELIAQIRQVYDNYGVDTQILAASIRHPQHVVQ